MEVRVSRVDQRRNRAVFSHKLFLNEEKDKLVAEIWENLNENNKISLFVRFVSLLDGEREDRMINKNK